MCNKISQKLVMNHHFPIILALCSVEQKEVLSIRKLFFFKKRLKHTGCGRFGLEASSVAFQLCDLRCILLNCPESQFPQL